MSLLLFANNALTTLANPVASTDTTITLVGGGGAEFPAIGAGEYFVATLQDAATGTFQEVVHVTALTGDVATVVRAQEGTAAQNWVAGDLFANLWTAGQAGVMLQQGQSQAQSTNYGADTGTANAYVVVLNPTLTANIAGMPIRVKIAHTSTGASTLNAGASVQAIKHPDGTDIGAGDIVAGGIYEFEWDGTNYQLMSQVWPVSNAGLAPVATATFKGRTSAGTGSPEDLTATQATALLNAFVGDSGSGGVKGLVPAPAAGDAAALKFLMASGAWAKLVTLVTNSHGSCFSVGDFLKIQTGSGTTSTGGTVTVTFPVAFTSSSSYVTTVSNVSATTPTAGNYMSSGNYAAASMTVGVQSASAGSAFSWIAVGI